MSTMQIVCLILAIGKIACSAINVWRDRYDRATYDQASAAVLLLIAYHGNFAS